MVKCRDVFAAAYHRQFFRNFNFDLKNVLNRFSRGNLFRLRVLDETKLNSFQAKLLSLSLSQSFFNTLMEPDDPHTLSLPLSLSLSLSLSTKGDTIKKESNELNEKWKLST